MANENQVEILKKGVEGWNKWRDQNPDVEVNLSSAHMEDANLKSANLAGANLGGAHLDRANLTGANLAEANLNGSHLVGANLRRTHLEGADLFRAKLARADLRSANLKRANLIGAHMLGTDLKSADMKGADLFGAHLQEADLRTVSNLQLNNTLTKGAHFSPRASDPWSVLRRAYTGPKFIFMLLSLIAFALPYIGKIGFWSSVNRGQGYTQDLLKTIRQRAQEQGIDDQTLTMLGLSPEKIGPLSQCLSEACEQRSVGGLLLGTDQNVLFWIFPFWLLPTTLIVYNLSRGLLTYLVAPMRDEEERSGYSPVWSIGDDYSEEGEPIPTRIYHKEWWQGYRRLYQLHRVLSVIVWTAFAAFVYNAWRWLSQPIYLPI